MFDKNNCNVNLWFVVLFSVKEHLDNTRDAIDVREHMVNHLEKQFSTLEQTLLNMQLRLSRLIQQWHQRLDLTVFIYECLKQHRSQCMHAQDYCTTRTKHNWYAPYYFNRTPIKIKCVTRNQQWWVKLTFSGTLDNNEAVKLSFMWPAYKHVPYRDFMVTWNFL